MNKKERNFAEFLYKTVNGKSPETLGDRLGVLELHDRYRTNLLSEEFRIVRKEMSRRFKELKGSLSNEIDGENSKTLRGHL